MFDEQVFEWKVIDMSALQIQPEPALGREVPTRPRLYVVPDLPRASTRSSNDSAKSSARPVAKRSPKASATGLADTRSVGAIKTAAYVAVATLLAGIGAGVGVLFQTSVDPADTRIAAVQQGDSLWSIASGLGISDRSVEDVVTDIRMLNGLDANTVVPGQMLTVPTK
ncbi:LysM peptidoglycan-binding domain-containing protein [Gleimia europaea]|uniref:LysM peptidoglycan-binding domain-containing protein n=1 Tax=Gleimia europaea TaxID=66228 RepID=UPI001E37F41E|nr:LysM peptidoglycan-binding domain-containing protein [Gleimia europaea]